MPKEMEILLNKKLPDFVWFDFEVLRKSTSHFSTGFNLPTH